jgi:hypothetical protein
MEVIMLDIDSQSYPPPRQKRNRSLDEKDIHTNTSTTRSPTTVDETDVTLHHVSGDGMTSATNSTIISATSSYSDVTKRRRLSSPLNTLPFQYEATPHEENNNNRFGRHVDSTTNTSTLTTATTPIVMVVDHPLPQQVNRTDPHPHHHHNKTATFQNQ